MATVRLSLPTSVIERAVVKLPQGIAFSRVRSLWLQWVVRVQRSVAARLPNDINTSTRLHKGSQRRA